MDKINRHNYEAYFLDFAEGNLSEVQLSELEEFLKMNPDLREELEDFELVTLPVSEIENPAWDDLKKPVLAELQNSSDLRQIFFVRAIESLLTESEKGILEELLINPAFAEEYTGWKQTILKASAEEMINTDSLLQFGLDRPISEFNYDAWLTAKTEGLLDSNQLDVLAAFAKTKENGDHDLKLSDNLRLKPATGIFYPDKSKLYKQENRKVVPLWIYRAAAIAAIFLFGIFIWSQLKTPASSDRPIAQQVTKKPAPTPEIDSIKTETQTPSDTLKQEKSEKEPPLDEWEMREPDPVEYAETKAPEAEQKKLHPKEINPISVNESIQIPTAEVEPELAPLTPNKANENRASTEPKQLATKSAEYKTLPQLAEKALAQKLNVPEENQDEMANIVAQRITDKMSKMLDTEFKTQTTQNDDNNTISYTLRIGSFEFSRTKKK